jgi:putative FmdB family regulatory protein
MMPTHYVGATVLLEFVRSCKGGLMPEYDYHCEKCAHDFSLNLSMADHTEKEKNREIRCPKCDSQQVKHVIQSVFVTTSKKS